MNVNFSTLDLALVESRLRLLGRANHKVRQCQPLKFTKSWYYVPELLYDEKLGTNDTVVGRQRLVA